MALRAGADVSSSTWPRFTGASYKATGSARGEAGGAPVLILVLRALPHLSYKYHIFWSWCLRLH